MTATDRARPLLDAALSQLREGDVAAAASALERAAALQQGGGRPQDLARSLQMAAFLRGVLRDGAAARALAEQAEAALPDHLPTQVASRAQRAEAEFADGRFAEAARLFGASLTLAQAAGLGDDAAIALGRRLGASLVLQGDHDGAQAAFAEACARAQPRIADFLRVEHAQLLVDAGALDRAARVLPAEPVSDPQFAAEILVVRARLLRALGRPDDAARAAVAAREHARAAVAPVPYFAAGVELAEIHDVRGERAPAYAVLAATWVTLGDLLGRDVARSWVEPCLSALRTRWGEADFDSVRREYEASRRAAPTGAPT